MRCGGRLAVWPLRQHLVVLQPLILLSVVIENAALYFQADYDVALVKNDKIDLTLWLTKQAAFEPFRVEDDVGIRERPKALVYHELRVALITGTGKQIWIHSCHF